MDAAGARCGVDPVPPGFERLADAFRPAYAPVADTAALEAALLAFIETPRVTLVEVDAEAWMASE
jgi:thiamine pyrophosphate-dependent acetolactate synthase large subunit-like protein